MAMKRMWSKGQVKNLSKEVIESGLVDNAKPIYCHPITIENDGGTVNYRLTCLIFNDIPTAFTRTTFGEWINALADKITEARIMLSGAYYDNANSRLVIASYLYKNKDVSTYAISGMSGNAKVLVSDTLANLFPDVRFVDNVNKIN